MWHVEQNTHCQQLLDSVRICPPSNWDSQTLFRCQIPKVIGCTYVEWVACTVPSILKNNSQAIRGLHKNLNDYSIRFRQVLLKSETYLTASLKVWKPVCARGFTRDVKVHRSSRLIIRRIKEVSLLECSLHVRCVSRTVWEMIYLYFYIRSSRGGTESQQTGMSIVNAGYGESCLGPRESYS